MQVQTKTVREEITEILENLTPEDSGYSGGISGHTRLVRDLGCESVDFVMLIVAIEDKFRRKNLPLDDLLASAAGADITVDQLVATVERLLG